MKDKYSVKSYQNDISTDGTKFHEDSKLKVDIVQPPMSKLRILKNLLVLCLGYLFLFTAYQGTANLQSTLNTEDNVGVLSQSVVYASMIVASLFLPKLIIRKFGCKTTLVMSAFLYSPYIGANFYPNMSTFVPASIILGIAGTMLWSAQCTYVNEISALYANQSSDSGGVVTARFFGIFFLVFQSTQVWSNLVSFFVLRPTEHGRNETFGLINNYNESFQCGINFCFEANENLKVPSERKRNNLVGIYLVCVGAAVLVMAFFLDTLQRKNVDDLESVTSRILATLKHLKNLKQLLLLPLTVFSGVEQGFILADFTKAYVACAWGIYHVGLVFVFYGIVDAVISITAGRLVKYIPRVILMTVAFLGNIGVCAALHLWHPNSDQYIVFFILAGVWGLSDGIWQTMLYSFYGVLFRSEEEAAFANYRLWEAAGFSIAFAGSSLLCMAPKIYIVLTVLSIGFMGYIVVEILLFFREEKSEHL